GRFAQRGSSYGACAGLFAAVTRAGIRNYHAHFLFRNVKSVGKFAAHAERPLRSCPDGEPVPVPLGNRGAWLKRRVRDVGDGISLFKFFIGLRQTVSNRSLRPGATAFTATAAFSRGLAEQVTKLGIR